MSPRTPLRLAALAALVGLLAACATVPYTGRRQLSIMSGAQEAAIGEQMYATMRRRGQLSRDARALDAVQEIGRRIAAVAGEPDWNWEFTLFDDPEQVNAWALPGGKVGVYTGILPIAKTEAGLATIIGHEIAHAIAHHSAERASQGTLLQVLGQGAAIAAGSRIDPGTMQLLMQAYGLGAQVGVLLPFGRAQESEADEIGLILMAKAGYDPRAALDVWERMAEVERKQAAPPEFLSTHPSYGTRIGRIREALPRALDYYAGRGERDRLLPSLAALERAPAGERRLLEAVSQIDRYAAQQAGSQAIAVAIADEFRSSPESVVTFANRAGLSPGEAALALAISRRSGTSVDRLVGDAQRGRSWYAIARDADVSPGGLAEDLDRIGGRATGRRR